MKGLHSLLIAVLSLLSIYITVLFGIFVVLSKVSQISLL